MDGLETYQRILAINPGQKAVIVSGYSETERVNKAQELGAGAYVRKPYVMEKIGAAIRMELDRQRSQKSGQLSARVKEEERDPQGSQILRSLTWRCLNRPRDGVQKGYADEKSDWDQTGIRQAGAGGRKADPR